MLEDNLPVESYLIKIYQQNEKILGLLERFVNHIAPPNPNDSLKEDVKRINHKKMERLSHREQEVVELILEGKLNKEIAYELSISLSTVESHRSNILRKLGVSNVAQLVKMYLQCQDSI